MNARFPNVRLILDGEAVQGWDGLVAVRGEQRHVRLRYPADFPERGPSVWETDLFGDVIQTYAETGHQYPNQSLCLYAEDGSEESWSSALTAADVLARFVRFHEMRLDGELPTGFIEFMASRQWAEGGRCVVPTAVAQLLQIPGGYGQLKAKSRCDRGLWVVEELKAESHSDIPGKGSLSAWDALLVDPEVSGGRWWTLPADSEFNVNGRPWADWGQVLACAPQAVQLACEYSGLVLVAKEGSEGFAAILRPGPDRGMVYLKPQIYDLEDAVFARSIGVTDSLSALAPCRVVIVGAGSLGAKVAVSLARSGISRFLLLDPEVLEPENISRHEGRIEDLFLSKVEVVKQAILSRNPRALVETHAESPLFSLPWAKTKAHAAFSAALRDPKAVVVVTTAEERSEAQINRLAVVADRPVVYGSVLGTADHGRVFRVIPGETACYECVCIAQRVEPTLYPRFGLDADEAGRAAAAYRSPSVPGLSIDVEQVALIIARLTMQTIGRMLSVDLGVGDEVGHHFLWTNRGGWVFDRPLQLVVEEYPLALSCVVCGGDAGDEVGDSDAISLEDLLAQAASEKNLAPAGFGELEGKTNS